MDSRTNPPVPVPVLPAVQEVMKPIMFAPMPPEDGMAFIAVPKDFRLEGITALIDAHEKTLPSPTRRRGTYQAADVVSLIAWLTANAPGAPVFAEGLEKITGAWRKPGLALIGIGNYSGKSSADWHDFSGRYDFPVSEAWIAWAGVHAVWKKQGEFAEFIEDRLYDLSQPKSNEKLSEQVERFLEHTKAEGKGSGWATPSALVELSRGLKLTVNSEVEQKVNLQSGEVTLAYSEEHKGQGGRPVKVPAMFFIRIPVFFGTPDVLIGVRLRYRKDGPQVQFQATLFAPDLIVEAAFMQVCGEIRTAKFPLYLGSPDRPK